MGKLFTSLADNAKITNRKNNSEGWNAKPKIGGIEP